ncbi:response regulator [Flavobacterium aestuarii]|uniref:response regulator n=1 Tax=Flavobacterium aestuarii TaxID=3149227 RepID=UPI0032B3A6CF
MIDNTMHILLADDDQDDRLFFADAFTALSLKINLKMVKNGEELMTYLRTPNIILPTIIFLDLNMPRKNGIQCLNEIRNDEKLKHLSIAIYSTSSSPEDIHNAFVLGANIYIRKPGNFETLKKVLHKVVTINWQYHISHLNTETFFLTV